MCIYTTTHALVRLQVVDETDRLLRQSYQNWLPHVVEACMRPQAAAVGDPRAACIAQRGLLPVLLSQLFSCIASHAACARTFAQPACRTHAAPD